MGKYVYAGFVVGAVPGVADPHITLAFVPVSEERQNDHRPYDSDPWIGLQNHIWKLYKALEEKKFTAKFSHTEYFGENGDVPVCVVSLPDQVLEHAEHFRTALYLSEVIYSTRFPFHPHVTVTDSTLSDLEIGEFEFEITGLFIDNGSERKILHLK